MRWIRLSRAYPACTQLVHLNMRAWTS
jgi:hypothetical protein